MSRPVDPPPVWVARNRWSDIAVPDLGGWTPNKPLSVVLPFYERSRELNLTLAGLCEQTYPFALFQVIVVDDGSPTDPPKPSPDLPFDLQIVTQDDRGYGLARARNLGAKIAEGDVVVFLDCDMIPERHHLEAHSRWHHAARRLVTVGFRFHSDFDKATPADVALAVREDRVHDIVSSEVQQPEWIEAHMRRTENLLGPHEDLYLMMSGGNLGVDRDLYWEAGGNNETFNRWGGEDNEFGYRALQLGAVVVPERMAVAWHQGEGHEPSAEELRAIWLQQAKLRNLIAIPASRRGIPGRRYQVPRLLVSVSPDGKDPETVGLTIDSLLASDFTDLAIGVGPLQNPEDDRWLTESYRADARVHLSLAEEDLEQLYPFSPARMSVPAGFGLEADAIEILMNELGSGGVGAVHITLPGRLPRLGAELRLTRAINRGSHVDENHLDETIGRLFGEKWVTGARAGFWPIGNADEATVRIRRRPRSLAKQRLEIEVEQREEELNQLKSRRALRIADALGVLWRARSLSELRSGMSALLQAFR